MNPFTGGCHYSGGCKQFVRGCGNCPSLIMPGPRDLSRDTLRLKRRVLAGRRLDVVSPSRWMNALAERSPVWPTGTAFHVIANGLDTEVFRPADKAFARRQLNLPADATLLAFGAEDLGNPRKGFHLLRNALPAIAARQRIECVVFGRGRLPESREGLPIIHEQGFVDSPERQALIYSAADLFALPSLEDNAPQTGLEAMACGTPVVAFDAGGIPEFVRPGETGLLAPVGDSAALARQIIDLAEHPRFRQRLAAGARKLIEADYDVRTQVRRYIELFVAALESRQTLNQRRAA
jgi:glycosyltransferase involved in cell wall biosynthesis